MFTILVAIRVMSIASADIMSLCQTVHHTTNHYITMHKILVTEIQRSCDQLTFYWPRSNGIAATLQIRFQILN